MGEPQEKQERRHLNRDAKAKAVLRLLRGEKASEVGDELGISASRLERWEATFVAAGTEALAHKTRRRGFEGVRELFKPALQWIALVAALVALILILLRFFDREPVA